jgi:hypothetical protein
VQRFGRGESFKIRALQVLGCFLRTCAVTTLSCPAWPCRCTVCVHCHASADRGRPSLATARLCLGCIGRSASGRSPRATVPCCRSRLARCSFAALPVGGIDPYTLMSPHGLHQTRWPNSLERAARISELLGEPCGVSRDYLTVKETVDDGYLP